MTPSNAVMSHVPAPPIRAEGLLNWRDIGGVRTRFADSPIRQGLAYRSELLAHLSPAALDELRCRNVGMVVDLRSVEEVERHGRIDEPLIDWIHRPLAGPAWFTESRLAGGDPMASLYKGLITELAPILVDVIEIIANASVPVVFHCTSGKDRTGIVSAILQSALGVDDDVVLAEYLASAENLVGHMEMLAARDPELQNAIPETLRARFAGVEAQWLDIAMDHVRAVGGVEAWLDRNGAAPGTIERLRSRFVPDDAAA